jgi:sigma-B regulation protein RsbQ
MTAVHRNSVKIRGGGTRALTFAHGYGCDQSMWRAMISAFENDFKLILFDDVGAGDSDFSAFDKTHYSSLRGYAERRTRNHWGVKGGSVTFVGHSVSSMIGGLAAIEKQAILRI